MKVLICDENNHKITWLICATVLIFIFLEIVPGRGIDWISDDGLFLAHAWSAANNFGFDGMLPQQPNYLLNAFLIYLGIDEIIYHRYIYYTIGLISAFLFYSSLEKNKVTSLCIIATTVSLCISFSSILLGSFFFPLALGFYFYSTKASSILNKALYVISGFFFALAAFVHIANVISVTITLFLIYLIDGTVRRSLLAPVFLLISGLLWSFYLFNLGIERFFNTPAAHDASIIHLLGNAFSIAWFFVIAVLIFFITSIFFKRKGNKRYLWTQYTLCIFATLYFCSKFFAAHLISIFPEFINFVFETRYSIEKLSKAHGLVVDSIGGIFYILIFTFCRWISESYSTQLQNDATLNLKNLKKWFSAFIKDSGNRNFLVATFGVCIIPAGYAGGSASSFPIVLSAFSGITLGLTFMLWRHIDNSELNILSRLLCSIWICMFILFLARMNLPTFEPIISKNAKVLLHDKNIKGIKVTERYQKALIKLKNAYDKNECQYKRFIVLDYVPILYFILQHEVPLSYGVVRPGLYYPESKIINDMNNVIGWCILDLTIDETHNMLKDNDVRVKIRGQIKKEMKSFINLPSPSEDIQHVILYVK